MKKINHLEEIDSGIDKLWIITLINTIFTVITGVATFTKLFR
jgi:hypothetical protein